MLRKLKKCNRLRWASVEFGLNINTNKIKFVIVNRNKHPYNNTLIALQNWQLERMTQCRYLEYWLHSDKNQSEIEILKILKNTQVYISKPAIMLTLSKIWCIVKIIVWGEAWTLKVNTINKIEAFELWTYKRLLNISWTSHKTLQRIYKERK